MAEPRLWTGGRVFTGRRYAEAILIDGGTVVAVGSDEEVRRAAPTGTEATDLAGRLLLPGLVDSHIHVSDLARFREGLDVSQVRGLPELLDRLRDWAAAHPAGPIVGRGLDVDGSLGGRWPTRADLDAAVPDRPVLLLHASGHAGVANSTMLGLANLDARSASEKDGRVGVDRDGVPNGLLYEEALSWVAPSRGDTVEPEAIVRTLSNLASLGVTTVATTNMPPEEIPTYRTLANTGRLPIRVRAYVRLQRAAEVPKAELPRDGERGPFAVIGTKCFADGAFGPRTAWLSEPYADAPATVGVAVETDDMLAEALRAANALRLAPSIHAIGDRGAVRAARLIGPYVNRTGATARIEHAALTPPETLRALVEVGPSLVVQPGMVWSDWWLRERLGAPRARWAYAFRTLADLGLLLAGSSDAPYDPPDPWRGLQAATQRRDELARSANPDPTECLGYEEALRLYGANGGTVLGEPTIGVLEPGASADLVIVEARDLSDAFRRGNTCVRETWAAGTRIFGVGAETPAASG